MKRLVLIAVLAVTAGGLAAAQELLATISYEQKLDIARYVSMGLGTVDASVSEYFTQPIRGIDVSVDNEITYSNLQEVAGIFHMHLTPGDIKADLPAYTLVTITADQLKIRVLKYGEGVFKLFMVEYSMNSRTYDCRIKIGQSKKDILKRLPHPNAYNGTSLIYLDREVKGEVLFRQLNIYFDASEKVIRVQLIAWDFI